MKSVKECTHGHCQFHHPQFRRFTEEELQEELTRVLDPKDKGRDYYQNNYPNWPQLDEEYRKLLAMMPCKSMEEFIAVCDAFETLQESQLSYIRHKLYLALDGSGVAEFIPCCR